MKVTLIKNYTSGLHATYDITVEQAKLNGITVLIFDRAFTCVAGDELVIEHESESEHDSEKDNF